MDLDSLLDQSRPAVRLGAKAYEEIGNVTEAVEAGREGRARKRRWWRVAGITVGALTLGGIGAAAVASPIDLPWKDPDGFPVGTSHIAVVVTRSLVVDGVDHACSAKITVLVPPGPDAKAIALAATDYLTSSAPKALPPDPDITFPHLNGSPTNDVDSSAAGWTTAVSKATLDYLAENGLSRSGVGVTGEHHCD